MKIVKKVYDDKKCKHNSIELTVIVPSIIIGDYKSIYDLGGYQDVVCTEYRFDFDSYENAELGFKGFMDVLSAVYNKHKSQFTIEESK